MTKDKNKDNIDSAVHAMPGEVFLLVEGTGLEDPENGDLCIIQRPALSLISLFYLACFSLGYVETISTSRWIRYFFFSTDKHENDHSALEKYIYLW